MSLLVAGAGCLSSFYFDMNGFNKLVKLTSVNFLINKNEKINSIAKRLKEQNLIFSEQLFLYGAKYKKLDKVIKFGEFSLTNKMSIIDILEIVTTNQALRYKVVIRDCMTNWEIIELFKKKHFLKNDLVHFDLAEGAFAPDTYNISFNTTFSQALQTMRHHQDQILQFEWAGRKRGIPIESASDLLILASIIEKEAATVDEMPIIASVFINRINVGMRLQSDPTVSYGLDFGNIKNRKTVTKNDLKSINDYNTYRISGLPASPICNPGKSAINAAANPAITKYFYFVLSQSGEHGFSETFEEHKKKVLLWRSSQE